MSAWDWALIGIYIIVAVILALAAWYAWDRYQERHNPFQASHRAGTSSFQATPWRPSETIQLPYMAAGSYASVPEVHHGRKGELHKDVVAAALHNPWLIKDIRIERAKTLPRGPEPRVMADNHQPLGELAPWVAAALTNAKADDTVTTADTLPQYVRDFLTCSFRDLPVAIRADQLALAVGVR